MQLILVPLVLMLVFGGRRLIRLSIQLTIAWCLALAAAIWLDGVSWTAPFLTLLLFVPALAVTRRFARQGRPRRVPSRPAAVAAPVAGSRVADDWGVLRSALGWSAARLDIVADVFGRFLTLADHSPFSPDTEELVIHIRKRAPELIARALADCRTANRAERRQRLDETLATLEQLARRAEVRRALLWREQGAAFEATRAHLTGGLGPDPLASV